MFRSLTTSALALTAMTAPAFADVTPEQVWQSWVDYYQSVGYTVAEGGRDMAGSTMTVRDVLITSESDSGSMEFKVPQVVLSDQGDGRVQTVFADELAVAVSGTDPDGGEYSVPVAVKIPGNSMLSSGAPEDMVHDFNYPTMDVAVKTMTTDGTESPLPINFALTNSTGKVHIVSGAPSKYDYQMKTEAFTFDGDVPDDVGGKVKFAGSIDGFESQGDMTAPGGDFTNMEEEMDAALKAGLAMKGQLKSGVINANFDYSGTDEQGQPTSGKGDYKGEGFDATFQMSQEGLGYKLDSDAFDFTLTTPQVPFPISYGIKGGSLDMMLPVSQRDEAQPFRFAYSLDGVTMAEDIWKMFDPQAALPRDPASLSLDLSGLMKVTKDMFAMPDDTGDMAPADDTDSATAEGIAPDAPADDAEAQAEAEAGADEPTGFEPLQMTINKFALDLLGAKVNATGELKSAEGGNIEAPIGQIHAEYEGVNTLIDTLSSIGLIPQEQMMGVRMMLAMFAKPVEGSTDKMATDLEFKEGGAIFANGQQIR
ncbi:DUF2125 domain-containing protein [Paracoccus aestuariivivens]|uniref:DUF2125 domain-containing protein n=1 Tax=Paracoccus aestuariivivens TaxID=1820333 RepID=A0A6L6JFA7_9RHOB|nr:DUF2125 domain-containing protein [Paracoccus aestuariivivens]MTH80246.1 DUF2125 domain-containing protein [Paracoccus aestuariivivens]